MKRRKKRQNNGLLLHFAHWETLKISEANGKMRLCILGHGHTLVTKRGAFWGGIPNCDYHGWSALFALQGGNKRISEEEEEEWRV